MFCATISVEFRLLPSLSSHCRYWIRPSTQMLRPFDKMLLRASPRLPQTMTGVPIGALLTLARLVHVGLGRRQAQAQHALPVLGVFELRVRTQVPDERYSIQAFCHGSPLLLAAMGGEHTRPYAPDQ